MRLNAISAREFEARWLRFEQRDGLEARCVGLGIAQRSDVSEREFAEILRFADDVPGEPVQFCRARARGDRLVQLRRKLAFARVFFEPSDAFAGAVRICAGERRAIVRDGLAVRAALCRLTGGFGRIAKDGCVVSDMRRMMHEARSRRLALAVFDQCAEHAAVQRPRGRLGHGAFDHDAGQFVPEVQRGRVCL